VRGKVIEWRLIVKKASGPKNDRGGA
jgi:hypothetical protein